MLMGSVVGLVKGGVSYWGLVSREQYGAEMVSEARFSVSRCPYEGHVPHTGRARTQEVAKASKLLSTLMMFETHQPLKF